MKLSFYKDNREINYRKSTAQCTAGGQVARPADVRAGGGDGDFLEYEGAVEGVVRGSFMQ